MKALCPNCFGKKDACEKCKGTGYIEVRFAKGTMHAGVCTKCAFDNGGFIVGPNSPYKTVEDRGEPGPCIACGGAVKFEAVGERP